MNKIIILLISIVSAITMQAQQNKYTELYYQRKSLFEVLGTKPDQIVFLGNSLTHGCEWHELLDMPNVVNRGINGDVVQGIYERIEPVVSGHPAKIFILSGANDVSHDLTADSIATAFTNLVKYIREATPNTRVYVQSMLPINNSFGRYKLMKGKEQVIRDINTLLRPRVEKLGATWVDLYPHFCDEEGNLKVEYTNDGLHLLGPGYLVWRDLVLPYVKE